jgi:hypothetical protein
MSNGSMSKNEVPTPEKGIRKNEKGELNVSCFSL